MFVLHDPSVNQWLKAGSDRSDPDFTSFSGHRHVLTCLDHSKIGGFDHQMFPFQVWDCFFSVFCAAGRVRT